MASSDTTTPSSLLGEYRQSQGGSPLLAEYRKAQEPSALQRFIPTLDDAKNVLSNEYEAIRGGVNSIFGGIVGAPAQALATVLAPQTAAEQQNPIAQGYTSAKVGDLSHLSHALDFNMARINAASARPTETSTIPPDQQQAFKKWLAANKVTDLDAPDSHFDYRGAFLAGINRGDDGHFPDTFKQHGHPTFSVESQYSKGPNDGGHWEGNKFVPAAPGPAQQAVALAKGLIPDPLGHIQQAIQAPTWFEKGEAMGAVPLDLGMILGATHGLASAADAVGSAVRASPTGPADVVPTRKGKTAPGAPQTETYGGQNVILDQYKREQAATAATPAPVGTASPTAPAAEVVPPAPVAAAPTPPAPVAPTPGPAPSPVVGAIVPDMGARIREYVDAAFAEPKRFDVPASITLALRNQDNLGFDTRGDAANAVLNHNDWAQRWQVPEPDRMALEKWRQRTLATLDPKGKVVGGITSAALGDVAPPLPKDLAKVSDQALLDGYQLRLDRLQGMDVNAYTRFDPNAQATRFGAGTALVNKAQAYLDKMVTELKARGFDDDQLDRMYRDHVDQQTAATAAAQQEASGFNPDVGYSIPIKGKAPQPTDPSLFGTPQPNLLGETTAPTMGESSVGQRPEGPPEGLSASLLRAQTILDDPKEQFLAKNGKPSPEYLQARSLLGKGRTAPPPPPTPTPGQGGLFESRPVDWSVPLNVARAAGEGTRDLRTSEGPPPPIKYAAPRPGIPGALQTMFAPATRTPQAAEAGGIIRFRAAEFARATEIAQEALGKFRGVVNKMTPPEQLALIDDLENGRTPKRPDLQPVALGIRGALDAAREDVRALGTGALERFNRDYFPHIWADPDKAESILGSIMSKRPLEGPKSFLRKRTIPTIAEGIEAGLVPVTTNPLDLSLLKLREMRRYIMGQQIMADMKDGRLAHYVPVFTDGPQGYRPIDDKIAKVYGPPTVSVSESFDPAVRQQLEAVLHSVGGEHARTVRMPGGVLGSATGADVRTRFGTDVTVLEHELGHALDSKYGLWDHLTNIPGKDQSAVAYRVETQKELRALADLRFEGKEPSKSYRAYVRQAPEKIANAVHALIYAPERMEEVAPSIKARLTAFMESKPELRPLLNIRKSLVAQQSTAEIPVGGLVVKGQYWAPEPVARVLNNYLAPGLRGNALYDSYMGIGNFLNQAQLGLSAFHLGFTSVDAAVSRTALGIEEMVAGRPLAAGRTLLGVPTAPITTYLKGSRVLKEYLNPGTTDLGATVQALMQGGGRARMDALYKNNSVEAFQRALRARQPGKAALYALPALLEKAAQPVLEHVVPRQKLGVFADLARFELSRLPKNATPAEVRSALGSVWDSVDNRMGQLVYDNLFWDKTLKDLSLASVRSVGWNLGTIRELGGGGVDILRGNFTHRAAYMIALPFTVGLMGAITTYLYTGHGPQTLKDYFYPPTGKINSDGNEERTQLPSYMKDVVAYSQHPWMTAVHKVNPLISVIVDMLSNKDFFEQEIRNPHDPFITQLAQEAKFVASQFIPLGVRNALQQRREGQSLGTQAQSFVGITPAPREMIRSPAQNLLHEFMAERGMGGATPEQQTDRQRRADITRGVRSGQINPKELGDSMRAGAVTRQQAAGILRGTAEPAWVNKFKNLTWEEGEAVYGKASPSEQSQLYPLLMKKRVEEYMRLKKAGVNDGRVQQLRQILRAAVGKVAQ